MHPTVRPYPQFNAEADAKELRSAMKGAGTDEQTIISIMTRRSAEQRVKIVEQFKTLFGKDLIKEFESELSGKFLKCVKALCYSHIDYDAIELHRAIKGAGTDEEALIEILSSRNNDTIKKIKAAYARMYKNADLEADIAGDTSGHFKRILVSLVQANRDENLTVNRDLAKRDAMDLYEAGEARWGTDESAFNTILVSKSHAYIRAVMEEFSILSGKDFETSLKSELSGNLLECYLAITRCSWNPSAFFAHQLVKAMKGAGTDDDTVIRIIVTRSEIDMETIKVEVLKQTNESLEKWIKGDTSGDYEKILLALIGH